MFATLLPRLLKYIYRTASIALWVIAFWSVVAAGDRSSVFYWIGFPFLIFKMFMGMIDASDIMLKKARINAIADGILFLLPLVFFSIADDAPVDADTLTKTLVAFSIIFIVFSLHWFLRFRAFAKIREEGIDPNTIPLKAF